MAHREPRPGNHSPARLSAGFLLAVLLGGAALLSGGCATTAATPSAPAVSTIQWPAPPEPARIGWVRSISGYQDTGINKGFWKKALEFFTGAEEHRIARPYGVATDAAGRIFIADPGAGVVHVMDPAENSYSLVGDEDPKPLQTPIGLARDDRQGLYITDPSAGRVMVYDLVDRTLRPFLREKLQRPVGIAYNRANGLVYIVDTVAGQVLAADENGNIKLRFGGPGEGERQFNRPTDIAVDGAGRIYVTDPLNYRIKIFTPQGEPLRQIGTAGDSLGGLNKPKGVAVDSEGHIYICDSLLDAVQVFDQQGRLLIAFGRAGHRDGEFWMPSGLWIDPRDNIYVADTYNRRIQVFRYLPVGQDGIGAPRPPEKLK